MKIKIEKLLCATLVNTIVGLLLALVLGIPLWVGVATLNLAGWIMPAIPMPSGLRVGVYQEAWTGQIVEHFTHKEQGTFLDGVPDFSRYANNDVIHLSEISGDPDILIDNKTYPLTPTEMPDGDVAIGLAKIETQPTAVSADELHALSYDKMAVVKERHGNKIAEGRLDKAIHAFAPAKNTDETPVIFTSGEMSDGRLKITGKDIIALRRKADKMRIPKIGRRLVLSNDHINDLLETEQKFRDQYYQFETGAIAKMYGFEIFEYTNCPIYGQDLIKKAFGAASGEGDFEASVFFYVPRMFKANGSTDVYASEAKNDPLYKRNVMSFTHRFVALPQQAKCACGAIVSKKA